MKIEILFEDDTLLVVNKPSGLLTQASVDRSRPDLFSDLRKSHPYLALHHRLDVGTSGVLLLCKDKAFNSQVAKIFKDRQAHKKYLALCYNLKASIPSQWVIENHLAVKKGSGIKGQFTSVRSGGDYAKTSFETLETRGREVLILAEPWTGRTHQIRVHLFEDDLPILGDPVYKKDSVPKHNRLMLHAFELTLPHPRTGEPMTFAAEAPPGFFKKI